MYTAPGSHQAVTHPIMNRARRRLTSVIEPITMSERRIPFEEQHSAVSAYFTSKQKLPFAIQEYSEPENPGLIQKNTIDVLEKSYSRIPDYSENVVSKFRVD